MKEKLVKLSGQARISQMILYRLACRAGDFEDANRRLKSLLAWWIDCSETEVW